MLYNGPPPVMNTCLRVITPSWMVCYVFYARMPYAAQWFPLTFVIRLSTALERDGKELTPDKTNALQWRHNGLGSISNHQHHDCLLNRSFRRRSKKTLKVRVTGLRAENSPVTGEFPTQMASNAGNISIWWRHHGTYSMRLYLITNGHAMTSTFMIVTKIIFKVSRHISICTGDSKHIV